MYLEKAAYTRPPDERLRPALDPDLQEFGAHSECQAWLRCVESETTVDLLERWIAGFQRYHPEIRIDVFIGGAGAAAAALAEGWADLAVVSRELAPDESARFEQTMHYPVRRLEIAGGSFRTIGFTDTTVVIVNKDNPLEGISLDRLADVLAEPTANGPDPRWGQLGLLGEWENEPINLTLPQPGRGFGYFLRERVLGGRQFRQGIAVSDRVNPIAAQVARDVHALGVTGLGHLVPGVKVLGLSPTGDGPFVKPTVESVATRAYPLARAIYLMLNVVPDGHPRRAISLFAQYVLSREGQQAVLDEGIFLPLPATVAQRELSTLAGW